MTRAQNIAPTVFVVDDDCPMRDSLVGLIRATGIAAKGFATGGAFYKTYQRDAPGCLVLNVRMSGQCGLELYQQLLREGKRLPVIFITAHADVSTAVAAMKNGAVEFLEKPCAHQTLLTLVRNALALDAQWRQRTAKFSAIDQRIARLNDRDEETLRLILAGVSNKAMASRLYISERAVEMRRAAIMRKLEVRSLAELLEVVITHRVMADIDSMPAPSRLR